jgi:hypothetical protein
MQEEECFRALQQRIAERDEAKSIAITASITLERAEALLQRLQVDWDVLDTLARNEEDRHAAVTLAALAKNEEPSLLKPHFAGRKSEAEAKLRDAVAALNKAVDGYQSSLRHYAGLIRSVESSAVAVLQARADRLADEWQDTTARAVALSDQIAALMALTTNNNQNGVGLSKHASDALLAISSLTNDRFGPAVQRLRAPHLAQWRTFFETLMSEPAGEDQKGEAA